MDVGQVVTIHRKDYTVFDYLVDHLALQIELFEEHATVTARTRYRRNPASTKVDPPLVLFGEELDLRSIALDGRQLDRDGFRVDERSLVVEHLPEEFSLDIVTDIYPARNTSLEGLYRSSGTYCTQCEAEGFRKITYYPDRPDVLTRFTTRIEADRLACPVLLSNGNLIEKGELADSRHYAVWEDPFPKPCYLFALVAGRLVAIEDQMVTRSGRKVALKIFVEERNRHKCDHAMRSLQRAMRWDEEVFGLEYDLDTFMIVAVDDFNMGAMENKGLNIFNSKYVLSTPETATDQDYLGIEGVVGHEYFHNWTGNRVTCRDWFQLSLKEGLTVFRDQEFSATMNSRAVKRIEDVKVLKNFQFKEDASPMAHPVRPDTYQEINNFYTTTVYNKGAEVIRMIHTLLGPARFRQGMDLYFKRHDGQAVTCEDFVAAMSDAAGLDLKQFRNWYRQAGTPILTVKGEWDERRNEFRLQIGQSCPETPGQKSKQPFHLPIVVGLLGADGRDLLGSGQGSLLLQLRESEQVFTIPDIRERPVVSFLRDFSAPVRVQTFQSRADLALLSRADSNLFNRWDALHRLAAETILELVEQLQQGVKPVIEELLLDAVSASLESPAEDPALLALSLQLPAETTLAQEMEIVDPDRLHEARQLVRRELATRNAERFMAIYQANRDGGPYRISQQAIGRRSLKNSCLDYLMALDPVPPDVEQLCYDQYRQATNMTDTIAALTNLVNLAGDLKEQALADFYRKWHGEPLVLDKWYAIQALSILPNTLARVKELAASASFSIANPNKVRALIGTFASGNHVRFHASTGGGYRFLADRIIELNGINPQIAARLVSPLVNWRRYDGLRQDMMQRELDRILAVDGLCRDVYEIVSKSR